MGNLRGIRGGLRGVVLGQNPTTAGPNKGPLGLNQDAGVGTAKELSYEILLENQSRHIGGWAKNIQPIDKDTLGRYGTSFAVHGNNRIRVTENGIDVTAVSRIFRVWRVWSAPLDPGSRDRTAEYRTGAHNSFVNDGSGGNTWMDIPGQQVPIAASERAPERFLTEFLVGVQDKPGFGGLQFIVVIDVTGVDYRVRMYKALYRTEEKWLEIFPMGFGFSGGDDKVTVALPPGKPAGNEDDYALEHDYGWRKFPAK